MKHELSCAIVKDLLPNYMEGLTSEETNAALRSHLETCPDCAALLATMGEPEEVPEEQTREVDYLKQVKRRGRKRVFLAVFCTVLLFIAGFALNIFIIGTPVSYQGLGYSITAEDSVLQLGVMSNGSANALKGWKADIRDGAAYVTGRSVLVSGLYRNGSARVEIPLEGISEVYLCGQLIWQDGMAISHQAQRLFEARTPYVGDAPALGRITNLLYLQPHLGNFTHTLQTSQPPYRWTLDFSGNGGVFNETAIDSMMAEDYAPLLLALVENLEEVGWTYTDRDGVFHNEVVTLEIVDARLPEQFAAYNAQNGTDWAAYSSVKDYASSPASIQTLLNVLDVLGF